MRGLRMSNTQHRTPKVKVCKDCLSEGITTKRKAPHPGPRCTTHHRKVVQQRSAKRRATYVEQTYGLTEAQYQALYEAQGGRCYICQRAKGTGRKRLAVDHDHTCCPGDKSCGECVRGLLCATDNQMLGHLRDDVEALQRAIDYLNSPPAASLFGPTLNTERGSND